MSLTKKPLRLWTCFWGNKHLDLFEKALVRSLSWPLNKDAIGHAKWEIWTKESEFGLVVDVAKSVGIAVELNAADSFINDLHTKYLGDQGVMMLQMFLKGAERCLSSGAQMLIAPPDTVFGGDSLANILQAGEQDGVVVFVVHIRVLPEILKSLDGSISNAKLVSLAMRNAHKSWTEAEFGHERINSHVGGIFWKQRPGGTYAVLHSLPTPYLINWTQGDYEFFSRQNPTGQWPPVFGEIDHLWPGEMVHKYERARTMGSSDDAFIVEITDPLSNVPPLQNYDRNNPDVFWRGAMHNKINRMFIVTLRGDE